MHWQTSEMGGQFPPGRRSGWGVLRCQVISFGPRAPKPAGDLRIDKAQVSAYISAPRVRRTHLAQVAELVDALVSGTSGAIRGGSSPLLGTNPDMIVRAARSHWRQRDYWRLPRRIPVVVRNFS